MSAIQFQDVHKQFRDVVALKGVSFSVERGERVALLGPNGAGKTTAVETLLGLRSPDRGSVLLNGSSPRNAAARRALGATPQNTGFPDGLRGRELIDFVCARYPHPLSADALIDAFGLREFVDRKCGELSGGQQRRVALALAFAGDPDVVVLDEPTTGLDSESRRALWTELCEQSEKRASLFTTHYLEEAQALATRVLVIHRGSIRFDGSPQSLRERFGRRCVTYVGPDGNVSETPDDADAYVRMLVNSGVDFKNLHITAPTLEEAFLAVIGDSK